MKRILCWFLGHVRWEPKGKMPYAPWHLLEVSGMTIDVCSRCHCLYAEIQDAEESDQVSPVSGH